MCVMSVTSLGRLVHVNPALLVVDVQRELLADARLQPPAGPYLARLTELLRAARERGLPILHAHYVTEPDGRGVLPHHAARGRRRCVRGTPGAEPPSEARPAPDEPVFVKHGYSAFANPELAPHLERLGADTLVIAGLYAHACVRQSALDALERGYRVVVVEDAVGSYDPAHAVATRTFLEDRGVDYLDTPALLERLEAPSDAPTREPLPPEPALHPVACIAGRWRARAEQPVFEHRNPAHWAEVLGGVPIGDPATVAGAIAAAVSAQRAWRQRSLEERSAVVARWVDLLKARADALAQLAIEEVGKPLAEARVEMQRMVESIQVALGYVADSGTERCVVRTGPETARARRCPLGVVAVVTPWNNPAFLPASKIAAAIALGNAVVWKPALECPATSIALLESLQDDAVGLPPGLVNLVFGDATTARALIAMDAVAAVTVTGSTRTGREVAVACGARIKRLQAELGGNNAALVTRDCDAAAVAQEIAANAFGYAGQGCTATRRLIVPAEMEDAFATLLEDAAGRLGIGDPRDPQTAVGPMISMARRRHVERRIEQARRGGARVFQAALPEGLAERGAYLAPTVVRGLSEQAALVQEETFAPLLVVQPARDLDDALRLCNAVPAGLVASLYSEDPSVQARFLDAVETGVARINLPTRGIHLDAPFGGWKESGLGPPEHGVWDLDFYTRWQAVYER